MKKYILGIRSFENLTIEQFDSSEQANYEAEEWVTVLAPSFEEATKLYETEFLKWQENPEKFNIELNARLKELSLV